MGYVEKTLITKFVKFTSLTIEYYSFFVVDVVNISLVKH